MELDDLKNTWEDLSKQNLQQTGLSATMISKMTKTKYYMSLKRITYPEIIGVLICVAAATFIGLNFGKLDTIFLQSVGGISILLLLTLSVISLLSLSQFKIKGNPDKPYVETLKDFSNQKIRFHKLQRINITLSYLLLVTTIVLFSKFFDGTDITQSKLFWTCSFTIGYLFLLFYSRWVSKHYRNTLRQTEDLLKELSS